MSLPIKQIKILAIVEITQNFPAIICSCSSNKIKHTDKINFLTNKLNIMEDLKTTMDSIGGWSSKIFNNYYERGIK